MQMSIRFLATAAGNRVLRCFQLYNYSGETLREGVVNVTRHSISFFDDSGALTLLGKLIESKRQHDLMRERLGQFYLLRPIRSVFEIANAYNTLHAAPDRTRNCQ